MAVPQLSRAETEEFDLIYRTEMALVWRVLRYHGVPADAVEDSVQEVFMVVYRRWADWDRGESLRSWLFGIARKVAATTRRGDSRRRRKLAAIDGPADTEVESHLLHRDALRRLGEVLRAMDQRLAAVFLLAEIEGATAPEIARQLGIKRNTVYSRLRRARARVNEAMNAKESPS